MLVEVEEVDELVELVLEVEVVEPCGATRKLASPQAHWIDPLAPKVAL